MIYVKKNSTLVAALSCVVVVLIAAMAILGISLADKKSSQVEYRRQLQIGRNYLEGDDYELAILAYRAAIEEYEDGEEAYYELSKIYISLERYQDARALLMSAIELVGSDRLIELYEGYFGEYGAMSSDGATEVLVTENMNLSQEKDNETVEFTINTEICGIISDYTFGDYDMKNRLEYISVLDGVYSIRNSTIGAVLYFENKDDEILINAAENQPYSDIRPSYVSMDNLSDIFVGIEEGKVYSEAALKAIGASDIQADYDSKMGDYIKFRYGNVIILLGTDAQGSFTADSWNRISSVYGTGAEDIDRVFSLSLKFTDSVTARGVIEASITFYRDSVEVERCTTDAYGNVDAELSEGDYTVLFEKDGYISETFVISVFSTGEVSQGEFNVSSELSRGQIRIVLEWGSYPYDLDSYLLTRDNALIMYGNKTHSINGETVAELDVDDIDGYGPETITVYDTSGTSVFLVHVYSSGTMGESNVSVKVYLPDSSEPIIYTYSGGESRSWVVFKIVDGEVVDCGPDETLEDYGLRSSDGDKSW